jgi:N-acetylneuraminic acid mutarotase
MFVWGGLGASSTLNDGARYDPAGDSWSAATTNGAPAARWLHTAVWTGTEMILWGGLDAYGGNPLNDGGRFYVPAEAWTEISGTAPVLPWPRTDATCVWTGSELLFWGGQLDDGHSYRTFNDGWRYQPTSQTVTAIPTNGAPTGRFAHSAVWTGSEMIIWGGNIAQGSGRVTNNGARYLPAANLWLPLNTTSSPSARAFHTAVWTGLEMIVWGGSSTGLKNGGLDDGGRYHPATDAWSPIATNNAPTPRFDHTAIWTGNEMIVWGGGTNLSTPVGSGARYHPGANVWAPLPASGAPAARRAHTAIWTGTEMIVWGGRTALGYVREGARYALASDAWQALPTAGAPLGREGQTAIWTGREMMIWGGENNGLLADGASYDVGSGTWLGVTTVGAPPPMNAPGATWTGKDVLISGQFDGNTNAFTSAWAWTPGKILHLYQKP